MENLHSTLHNDFSNLPLEKGSSKDVMVKLDLLLETMDVLLEKMKKTGNHVEKVKNNAYFHS